MRPDFAKVLVEHERRGSYKSYRDVRTSENRLHLVEDAEGIESDAPSKRSMLKPNVANYNGKEFSENLNPLRKWLKKNVGRPWNKIYSELRQQFKPTNTINAHIYQHLFQYVEFNVVIDDDGEVCPAHQTGYYRHLSGGELYVDPHGILRKVKTKRRRLSAQLAPEFIGIDATTALAKREGSTLSMIERQSWDPSGDLGILTRADPIRARNTHVCLVGHVTPEELHRLLDDVQRDNGLVNRVLWTIIVNRPSQVDAVHLPRLGRPLGGHWPRAYLCCSGGNTIIGFRPPATY